MGHRKHCCLLNSDQKTPSERNLWFQLNTPSFNQYVATESRYYDAEVEAGRARKEREQLAAALEKRIVATIDNKSMQCLIDGGARVWDGCICD